MSGLTTADFISRATKRHGSRFSYKVTEYTGIKSPLIIICRDHGKFVTKPGAHISQSGGCRKCFSESQATRKIRYDRKAFIKESKLKFGKRFSYTDVQETFSGVNDFIVLTCKKHGRVNTTIVNHLKSKFGSCSVCSNLDNGKRQGTGLADFLSRSKEAHGSLYAYGKVDFRKMRCEVEITCKVHGSFWQLPKIHVNGHGCPDCYYTSNNRKYQRKTYILNGKEYSVLGYENIAFDYILEKGLCTSRDLELKSIPVFHYRYKGKEKRYYPDAFVPNQNRVLEIKSPYTLVADFEVLKHKRKSVVNSGHKFSLLVFKGNGARISVPKN